MKFRNISLLLVALLTSCNNAPQQQTTPTEEQQPKVETPTVAPNPEEKKAGGTNFQKIGLEQAIEKAKAEGKLIFINMHTKTCRPCRMMEKVVFPQEKLGTYMNEHFISVEFDAEDGEGAEINTRYGVSIYPTYVIVDTTATKLGEIIGAEKDIDKLIDKINAIINPTEESTSTKE